MKFYLTLTLLFYCLQLIKTETKDEFCRHLKNLKHYKSDLVLHQNNKDYQVKEYVLETTGKISIKSEDVDFQIYFPTTNTFKKVKIYNRLKNTCQEKDLRDSGFVLEELGNILVNYADYDGVLHVGPTSLITYSHNIQNYINAKQDEYREKKSIYCSVSKTIYEQYELNTILPLSDFKKDSESEIKTIFGYSFTKTYDKKFSALVSYNKFVNLDLNQKSYLNEFNDEENFWVLPDLCNPILDKSLNIEFSEKLEAVIEQTDELNSENSIKRKVVADLNENYYRFDDLTKDVTKILDIRNHFTYEIYSNLYCEIKLRTPLKEESEIHFALLELKDSKKFKYVGQEVVSNVLTSVYRKQDILDAEKTVYYTVYIKNKVGSLDKHDNELIKITKKIYQKKGEESVLINYLTFNIFDFKIIKNNKLLAKYFDLSKCLSENLKSEIALIAENDFEESFTKLNDKEFENILRKEIINVIDGSITYVPKININIDSKEILAQITLLEPISPLFYFEDKKSFKDDPKDGIFIDVNSIEECAMHALKKNEIKGFIFCENLRLDPIRCELHAGYDFFIPLEEIDFCKAKVKINLPSEFQYKTLKDKIDEIITKASSQEIVVRTLDHNFRFTKTHIYTDDAKIDSSKLFELVGKNMKVKSEKKQKKIIKQKNNFSLGKCYSACIDKDNDFQCDSFSYCKRENAYIDCSLSVVLNDKIVYDDGILEEDLECDFFLISPLKNFEEHEEKKINTEENKVISTFIDTNSFDCAHKCLTNNKADKENVCLSFQVCEDEQQKPLCTLNTVHTLYNENVLEEAINCNVFSAKHILNFDKVQTKSLAKIKTKIVESIDQCATLCGMNKDCNSFNLCENNANFVCDYKSDDGEVSDKKKSELLKCQSFEKKAIVNFNDDFKYYEEEKVDFIYTDKGFTTRGFIGFLFLVVIVGFLVGAAGLYIHKAFIRKNIQVGDFAVNFSNFDNEI